MQELSAKINANVYQQSISDSDVDTLIKKIKTNLKSGDTYLDVYQLGFGNNPNALPFLRELVANNDREYIRQAAISSLGILKDQKSLNNLIVINETAKTWSERAMALKAIGDLGADKGYAYLQQLLKKHKSGSSKEDIWTTELINLYID